MHIAKIVGSQSHIEYLARVIDKLDVEDPPHPNDYGLGQFVSINLSNLIVIGVIYNTELISSDFAMMGLRLSSEENNKLFSPDYLQEQGIMIKILILGYLENNAAIHKAPIQVLPLQSQVRLLEEEKFCSFHQNSKGKLLIGYYTQVIRMGGLMGSNLLNIIINKLENFVSEDEQKKLALLKQNLNWQQTLGIFNSRG
ncbi:MAG: hypothetical protein HY819_02340 [Acidobacteria bacterium]|nr:hypothetical protein [Acidobacteriota bacterium]